MKNQYSNPKVVYFSNFLKHPFILLLIGSAISSYLLPVVLAEAAKKESDRMQKLSLAFKFINKNSEMNQDFNSLLTSLELFHKYSSANYLAEEQKQLRMSSKDLYMKFDKNVWWWHWNLYEEAKTWKLLHRENDDYVKRKLKRYSKSWERVLQTLPVFWDACLDPNYRVRDSTISKYMDKTRQEFSISLVERDSIIRALVGILDIEPINN